MKKIKKPTCNTHAHLTGCLRESMATHAALEARASMEEQELVTQRGEADVEGGSEIVRHLPQQPANNPSPIIMTTSTFKKEIHACSTSTNMNSRCNCFGGLSKCRRKATRRRIKCGYVCTQIWCEGEPWIMDWGRKEKYNETQRQSSKVSPLVAHQGEQQVHVG